MLDAWLIVHGSWPRGVGLAPGPALPWAGPAPLGHEQWATSLAPYALNHSSTKHQTISLLSYQAVRLLGYEAIELLGY